MPAADSSTTNDLAGRLGGLMDKAAGFAQQRLMRPEFVIPAKAGIQGTPRYLPAWMPAFAGMTVAM
jgi:hypothetical protein